MNIVIINPPAQFVAIENPDEQGEDYLAPESFGLFPPMGPLSVLTYLDKNSSGHTLSLIDCVGERITHEQLPERIRALKPHVVGMTSFTASLVDICLAARNIRQVAPEAHFCLGGHHPMAYPVQAARLKEFDSIVVGEGEVAFTELIMALETSGDITKIRGVYTAESIDRLQQESAEANDTALEKRIVPAYIEDIDQLPMIDRKYIRHVRYHNIIGLTSDLATLISSRGCPHRCIYCDVPHKKYRSRSLKLVVDEIEHCLSLGYREIRFFDDLFNITEKRVIQFCDEVKRRNLKFNWDFRGRVNSVTYDSLVELKRAGCRMISFGVETGSDEGLKALKKGTTTQQIRQTFAWCRKLGIRTVADFMIGLPFEKTREDVRCNLDFLFSIRPDYVLISILALYPHTEVFDEAIRRSLIKPGRWEEFSANPYKGFSYDHWEEHLSLAEMIELQKEAYRRFYFRPSYIWQSIRSISSFHELRMKVSGAMELVF